MSIKSPTREKHAAYTGADRYDDVLANIAEASKAGVGLKLTSVLVPGFIDAEEIEKIAELIAEIDPSIPYQIKGYVPVPGAPWRKATPEEVADAAALAKKHLKNVTSRDPAPENFKYTSVRVL